MFDREAKDNTSQVLCGQVEQKKSDWINEVDVPAWKIWDGTFDFHRFAVFHLVFFFQPFLKTSFLLYLTQI